MKRFSILAMAFAATMLTFTSCDEDDVIITDTDLEDTTPDTDDEDVEDEVSYATLTFEDQDGDTFWADLIPADQYYGSEPLYSDVQYSWSDETTGASGSVNADAWGYYGYAFSSGGIVVSNYTAEVDSNADYNLQLNVPADENGVGGYDGSANFAVAFAPAILSFDEPTTIADLYLANTSYVLNSCINGDAYFDGLEDTDYVTVTITGYDAEGLEIDSVVVYMAEDGNPVMDWTNVDLSGLGAVSSVEFTCQSSNATTYDGVTYYNNVPEYIAIDNITVVVNE